VVGVAERRYADRAAGEILDAPDLAGASGRRHGGEQRQAPGRREASDIGAASVSLQGDVEGGRRVIDGAADQRLHGGVAAARVDELDIEPLLGEMAVGARHLVGHDA
jgi:hypothetical protein